MSQNEVFASASYQIDLGTGRRTEIEIDSSGNVWLAAGELTVAVDLWMKRVGGIVDLRIHVERTKEGITVAIDRGNNPGSSPQGDAAARLIVRIDEAGNATFPR